MSEPSQSRDLHVMRLFAPKYRRRFNLPIGARLIAGLALLIAIGTLLLYFLPGVAIRPLTFTEALFTATSAATITGLGVVPTSAHFTFLGQVIILCLIQMGGLGYMVTAVLILGLLGHKVSLYNRLALTSSLGLDRPTKIIVIMRRALIGMLIIEAIGTVLLYLHWRINAIVPADKAFFYAIFHAISAFCNAGFDLFAGLPAYPGGIPGDTGTLLILGMLIIIGGLGLPVLTDLFYWRKIGKLSLNSRITLAIAAILILVGWIGLFVAETQVDGILYVAERNEKIVHTLFQSVSARTAGFPGFRDFDNMQPASRLLVMGLMFIGCAPASMGGGITTGTFAILTIALFSYARGLPAAQVRKRVIASGTVRRAGAVLTISIGVVFIASWLILITNDFEMNEVLFEVISALATCGLSLGITGELNTFGLYMLMGVMFWGRLGALTIVVAILQRGQAEQLLTYPEAVVLIG